MISAIKWVLVGGMVTSTALGCGGRRGAQSAGDGGTGDAATNAFAEWCASNGQNYANLTCTGSSEGDTCPGQIYCDSCGRNVDTRCVCERDATGFSFECDDPCASCEPETVSDAGTTEPDASTNNPHLDACVVRYGDEVACLTLGDASTASARADLAEMCEAQTDSDPPAQLVASCPAGDAFGACALNYQGTLMDYIFYAPTDPAEAMAGCDQIGVWRSF